jgi:hypothetical protein
MARAKGPGNGRLEEALATLIQNQATLVQNQAAFVARMSEIDARVAEMDRINAERFARIEERFARIEALLLEHNRILQALPDAIREKTGFKAPGSQGKRTTKRLRCKDLRIAPEESGYLRPHGFASDIYMSLHDIRLSIPGF